MKNVYLDKITTELKAGTIEKLETRGEYTILHSYNGSKIKGRSQIVLEDCLWENDVPSMVNMMKKAGIKKFVIASGYSNLINTLAAFEDNGCKMVKLIKIVYVDNRFGENEEVTMNGIEFKICE